MLIQISNLAVKTHTVDKLLNTQLKPHLSQTLFTVSLSLNKTVLVKSQGAQN